jgi:hypothetical protein
MVPRTVQSTHDFVQSMAAAGSWKLHCSCARMQQQLGSDWCRSVQFGSELSELLVLPRKVVSF